MEIGWIMLGFFVFVTFIFMVIAVFFPEWVGITGKKALEIQKEHAGTEANPPEPAQKQKKTP